jgi:hypothetical protein
MIRLRIKESTKKGISAIGWERVEVLENKITGAIFDCGIVETWRMAHRIVDDLLWRGVDHTDFSEVTEDQIDELLSSEYFEVTEVQDETDN